MKNWCILFHLLFCSLGFTHAQGYRSEQPFWGVQGGLSLSLGTHDTGIGLHLKGFVGFDYAQLNLGNTAMWRFYSYGKRKHFFENRAYVGAAAMFGKKGSVVDFELDGLTHQSQRNGAVAYNFVIYSDNAGTSQLSGGFGVHIYNFALRFENDVFAGQARDRFRTGILWATVKQDFYKVNAGMYLWTGETRGSFWDKSAKSTKMPSGYRALDELPFGKTSHGIYFGGAQFLLPFGNIAQVKIGADSEHFRHFFQNRLTHDLMFLPEKVQRNTPHYPRLDADGCPVFERELVRKTKFYFQAGLND